MLRRWAVVTRLVLVTSVLGTGAVGWWGSAIHSQWVDPRVVAADNEFGFRVLSSLTKDQGAGNVFVSPTSIAMALSMVYNGAAGGTQQAMAKALELQGVSLRDLNRANRALLHNLTRPDRNAQVRLANSLWGEQRVKFTRMFLSASRWYYKANVQRLDLTSPAAAGAINGWVRKQTRGKVPKIVGGLSPLDVLVLANATYFKGKWKNEFDPHETQPLPFTLPDGAQKNVPMMRDLSEKQYWHLQGDGFEAVRLPYKTERYAMYIFLPDKGTDLSEFINSLTAEKWAGWLENDTEGHGDITMPRFTSEYEARLNDTLSALGMGEAFDEGQADFSNMASLKPLFISEVLHKTYLEVNEEGTVAAAASLAKMTMGVHATFSMIVDRPFFCAICDEQTRAILFMGAIEDPTAGA